MSIYRRKGSPNWWVSISVAGRKTRRSTGTSDRSQAEEFEKREAARLYRVHKLRDASAVLWSQAAAQWLNDVPEKSKAKESSVLGWLSAQLENEPLRAIDRDAVRMLRELALAEGWAKATVDRHLAILRAVLRKAVENGYIEAAPVVPMFGETQKDFKWLSPEEFDRLKKHLPEHLQLAAEFAVLTGLRMRSMLNLTWDRVDLSRKRFWIPGEQMKAGHAHGMTISKDLERLFVKLRTASPNGTHVFQYQGKPIDDCNTRAFQNAVEASGVGPLRWHDLRHTFASWAVQSGMTLQEVMQMGGWRTYSSVLRYAHLAPDHLSRAANSLARFRHSGRSGKSR